MTIPDIPEANGDLADIRQKWLAFCSHDLYPPSELPCICPTEDHRPVIAALVGEVETLRAEVARLEGEGDVYATEVAKLNRTIDEVAGEAERYRIERDGGVRDAIRLIQEKRALIAERDEAQALLRLAPHHQQQVETLRAELVQARAEVVRMRVVLALHGGGIDPNGYYEGTPGSRLGELLAAERELGRVRPVVEAACSLRKAAADGYERRAAWAAQAVYAAVDQMAPSTPPSTPESDGQGEVAVTDAVEGSGGAEALWHVGRSWEGTPVEDNCPCPKEPCGLINPARSVAECLEHPVTRGKSLRQSHRAKDCPGVMRNV